MHVNPTAFVRSAKLIIDINQNSFELTWVFIYLIHSHNAVKLSLFYISADRISPVTFVYTVLKHIETKPSEFN